MQSMLLLVLLVSTAAHNEGPFPHKLPWQTFCKGRDTYSDTNYPMHIVDQVFEDHWPYLYQFQRLGWKTQAVFYMALLFINLYPHAVQTDRVLSCGKARSHIECNMDFFKRYVVPALVALGREINYIDYARRLCLWNHVPLLPDRCWDMLCC